MVIYNLALLPDTQTSRELEHYSQELAKKLPGPYILGVNSLPHLSVLQFTTDKDPRDIWDHVKAQPMVLPLIDLFGFYADSRNGKIWFGIRVGLTEELMVLQKTLIDLVRPQKIINWVGPAFYPHFTLGCGQSAPHLPSLPYAADLMGRKKAGCRLVLGSSGPNLQFEKVLFEFE